MKRPVPIQFQPHDNDQQRLDKLRRLADQVAEFFVAPTVVAEVQSVFTPTTNGLVPAPGSATGFLRYDGMWVEAGGACDCAQIEADIEALQTGLAATNAVVAALTTTDIAEGSNLYFSIERAQDAVGTALTNSSSIDLVYDDATNTITATLVDEYAQDLVGAMLADSASIDFAYNDVAGTFTAAVLESWAPTWTANHRWTDNDEVQLGTGGDLRLFHDGTNSIIRNDTGDIQIKNGAATALTISSSGVVNTAGVTLAVADQRLQGFTIRVINSAGTIQHNIGALGDASQPSGAAGQIVGQSNIATNTPTGADASTAFAAGVKISTDIPSMILFNVAGQSGLNAMGLCTLYFNNTTLSLIPVFRVLTNDVNGVTQTRFGIQLYNPTTGALISWTTALGTPGYQLHINVLGFIK
jgi:hypothetical protein